MYKRCLKKCTNVTPLKKCINVTIFCQVRNNLFKSNINLYKKKM